MTVKTYRVDAPQETNGWALNWPQMTQLLMALLLLENLVSRWNHEDSGHVLHTNSWPMNDELVNHKSYLQLMKFVMPNY